MNTGMEEEVALRKSENIFDAPLLSCRDKAKIERNKRNQERQREGQYQMHVAEIRVLRAGMPPVGRGFFGIFLEVVILFKMSP